MYVTSFPDHIKLDNVKKVVVFLLVHIIVNCKQNSFSCLHSLRTP